MSISEKELVSICIPTFNGANYIERTIKSVIQQTYTNLEIIICDDGSTDNTVDLIKAINDNRIFIAINHKNLGLTANWNAAIEHANGTYVKLLCGDDVLMPQCIEKQIAVFKNDTNNEIALVSCLSDVIDADDNLLYIRKNLLKPGLNNSKRVISKSICFGTNIIGEPMSGLFRKEHFSSICQFDGSNPYLIDFDFWVKLMQNGSLYVVPEHLASFRISSNSISSTLNLKQYTFFCLFSKKLLKQKKISYLSFSISCLSALFLAVIRNVIFMKVRKKNKTSL